MKLLPDSGTTQTHPDWTAGEELPAELVGSELAATIVDEVEVDMLEVDVGTLVVVEWLAALKLIKATVETGIAVAVNVMA